MSKLDLWQERLAQSDAAYGDELVRMDERERLYEGSNKLRPTTAKDWKLDNNKTPHVRNIVFENIEAQVSSSIPQPKVTARRQDDEKQAELIEHLIRNELDRMPFEQLNDMAERIVPMQGGCGYLIEWDESIRKPDHNGEIVVTLLHPNQLAPQPGVYTSIDDMDWIIVKIPTTKEYIRKKYGISVENETEKEPQIRSLEGDVAEDAVTLYIGYEKNDKGGVNKYTWCNDVQIEDIDSYQSRRIPVCNNCGHEKPYLGQKVKTLKQKQVEERAMEDAMRSMAALNTFGVAEIKEEEPEEYHGGACPYCGADDWSSKEMEYESVPVAIQTANLTVPGAVPGVDEEGNVVIKATMIPFYTPNRFPIVLQKSVSMHGHLLGSSDVDIIEDQQNTINRMEKKIIDRICKAGTKIFLPPRADLDIDPNDQDTIYLTDPSQMAMIGSKDFTGNLQFELAYLQQAYEEARQLLGITDSYQGRNDATATSGVAKQFAAAQSAGRLESKRILKNFAYSQIFQMIFQFRLAYSDEPIPVSWQDSKGNTQYDEFSRYDFLRQTENGEYYYDDEFLFSVDSTATLAQNREAMWQQNRELLATGAFGDPMATETLILFWSKMEALHYPTAGETKAYLEDKLEREQQMLAQQQMMAQAQAQAEQNSIMQAQMDAERDFNNSRQPIR